MTLFQLWRRYTSQELFGETLREADPELFDELNTAIEKHDEHKWPCSRWNADGSPNTAATIDAYEAREPLVQEVIRHATDFAALSMVAVDIPFSEHAKRTVARIEARSALLEAARKLAEWKP